MSENGFDRKRVLLFKELGASAAERSSLLINKLNENEVDLSEISSGLVMLDTLMKTGKHSEQRAVGIFGQIQGEAPGYALLMFPYKQALSLIYNLTGRNLPPMPLLIPYADSALEELSDILISSCLDELSDQSGLTFHPNDLSVTIDMAGAIVSSIVSLGLQFTDKVFNIGCNIRWGTNFMESLFLYLPEDGSIEKIEVSIKENKERRADFGLEDLIEMATGESFQSDSLSVFSRNK